MKEETLKAYDATRNLSDKAFKAVCYAPFISLYFDTLGFVRVCCQNTMHTVGNLREQRLDEIWRGEKIRQLRQALIDYDFKLGCRFCEWQLGDGNYLTSFMRSFDEFPVASEEPEWPVRMEFSVSNTCNLECVMCNGEWSSSIRSRREKLTPLPKSYGDEFFEDLAKYLPHLRTAKFLGGEPFLAQESLRVWEMMVDQGLSIPCHVTTNGTQYNKRVERIINALPVSFSISMDGITKATVESIRVNAHHETVLENFKRFHAYARERRTYIGLTFCLMQKNWHEFGEYLLFGDEYDCQVVVNTVIQPLHLSLHVLPHDELQRVVQTMEKQGERILPQLKRNRQVWIDQLERLRHRLDTQAHGTDNPYFVPLKLTVKFPDASEASDRLPTESVERASRRKLERWARDGQIDGWVAKPDGTIDRILSGKDNLLGVPVDKLLGQPVNRVNIEFLTLFGERMEILDEEKNDHLFDRIVALIKPDRSRTYLRTINFPRIDEFGKRSGSVTLVGVTRHKPPSRRRLADFVPDRDPETLTVVEDATLSEATARRMLRRWANGGAVDKVEAGLHDDVRSVGEQGFLGLAAEECLNLELDDVINKIVTANGSIPQNFREVIQTYSIDRAWTIEDPNGERLCDVRFISVPRYDEQGLLTGTLLLGARATQAPDEGGRLVDNFNPLGAASDPLAREKMTDAEAHAALGAWAWFEPIHSLACDYNDKITATTAGADSILGLDPAACLGKTVNEFLGMVQTHLGSTMEHRSFDKREDRMASLVAFRDGEKPWTLVRAMTLPRYDADGDVVGTVTLAVAKPEPEEAPFGGGLAGLLPDPADAPPQRGDACTPSQAEFQLRRWADEPLSIETARLDANGIVLEASRGFAGVPEQQCLGRPFFDVLAQARTGYAKITLAKDNRSSACVDRLYELTDSQGASRFARIILVPNRSATGSIEGYFAGMAMAADLPSSIGHETDTFDLVRTDEVRRASKTRDQAREELSRWSDDGEVDLFLCDLDDQILGCERPDDLLGMDATALVGRPLVEMFAMLRDHYGSNVELLAEERTLGSVERTVRFSGKGEVVTVRSITLPRYDGEGRLVGSTIFAARTASSSLATINA